MQLILLPREGMTWSMWFRAAVAIGVFLDVYNCIAFEYEVEVLGIQGIMGSGSLDESDSLMGGTFGTSI